MTIEITNYSEKALVIRGPKEEMPIEQLKQLNARWNPHLTGGPGWIISKKKQEQVYSLINSKNIESQQESKESKESEESKENEESKQSTRENKVKSKSKQKELEDVLGDMSEYESKEIKETDVHSTKLEKNIIQNISDFCILLRNNKVKESKEKFEKLPTTVQRLFLHHCWNVLSHKNKYPEDSYKTAFLLFKLFRSKEWKEKNIYKKYLRLSSLEAYYKKANDFFKTKTNIKVKPRVKTKASSVKKTASKSASKSVKKSASKSASKSVKKSTSKSTSKSASKSTSKSASRTVKKYDKEFQRYQEPKELDPLYLFYTSLYSQKPTSPLAITWLTEHGVFEGSERKSMVKKYEKLKQAGKLIK